MNIHQLTPQQEKIVDFLANSVKYHGFGESEEIKNKITDGLLDNKDKFQINISTQQEMNGNKIDFILNFKKDDKKITEKAFFNSFKTSLTTEKGEERTHTFGANKFTAKESINLLEGRSVKTESKAGEPIFVKLNFSEPKNEYGNYQIQSFHKEKYGVDTEKIVEKSGLIFDKPEYKDNIIKSLEKGNIVNVKFTHEGNEIEGKAVLNPQYKNISFYDKDMNRLNTNKPIQGLDTEQQEKNNVRQQGISRSI